MWFKVDDKFSFHSKVVAAGNSAMGLWVRAGAWASAHETDGAVPKEIAKTIGSSAEITRLLQVGLWTDDGETFQFHDWLDFQPSAHNMQLVREKEGRAGAQGNHQRWHVSRGISDPDCKLCVADRGRSS